MPDLRHDLLVEPLFRVREPAGTLAAVSLAEVLARLARNEEIEFVALQAHQEHAWHAFLVQVAAMALHRAGATAPFQDEAAWREALRDLSGGTAAWCLVVDDLSLPAFLQPPVPEGSLETFKLNESWDDLELLATAKNHDVKRDRVRRPELEHWIFVLVALQTMQGVYGVGMYGTARMNGGLGNRPCVAYAPDLTRTGRFRRDVAACLSARDAVVERCEYQAEGGIGLVWTKPWNGASDVGLGDLDPWFVDCCRRVRLTSGQTGIRAHRIGTGCARIAAKERHGMTGDPWTPVHRTDGKSLTIPAAGFGFERVQELLLGGEFEMGAAGQMRADDGPAPWFLASAMVRGQGKTDGLHERRLQVPAPVRRLLRSVEGRERLRDRSKRWVDAARVSKLNVLSPALRVLMGEGEGMKPARDRFLSALDAAIDRAFFERLWATAELSDAEADAAWARDLVSPRDPVGLARAVLEHAIDTVPTRTAARYRAIAEAEGMFGGCARKRFPAAFPVPSGGAL